MSEGKSITVVSTEQLAVLEKTVLRVAKAVEQLAGLVCVSSHVKKETVMLTLSDIVADMQEIQEERKNG